MKCEPGVSMVLKSAMNTLVLQTDHAKKRFLWACSQLTFPLTINVMCPTPDESINHTTLKATAHNPFPVTTLNITSKDQFNECLSIDFKEDTIDGCTIEREYLMVNMGGEKLEVVDFQNIIAVMDDNYRMAVSDASVPVLLSAMKAGIQHYRESDIMSGFGDHIAKVKASPDVSTSYH